MSELFDLYRRCFPCCVREEAVVRELLKTNRALERRGPDGRLIGAAVTEKNNILLLCVDAAHRNRGIGAQLLAESERLIREANYPDVTIGAGDHYIMPGVPSASPMPGDALLPDALYPNLEDHTAFFRRRGYVHQWDCSCFDMRMELRDFSADKSNAFVLRIAEPSDRPAVIDCVTDAHEQFVRYYRNPQLYLDGNSSRVLVAEKDGVIAGALLVSLESEGPGRGSVGCTAVREVFRGQGIASDLVIRGTQMLKDAGMREAFLGYTYSGLDRLYGRTGYRICCYYFMAKKAL